MRSDDISPICPRHYAVMVFPAKKPVGTDVDTSETTGDHHWSCPVDGCPQNYSPSLGYFAIEKSLLCLAKTSYTCKMNDLAQSSIRIFPLQFLP